VVVNSLVWKFSEESINITGNFGIAQSVSVFNHMELAILTSNPQFCPEVGGRGFLQIAGKCLPLSPVFHLRRKDFSFIQIAASETIPYESVTNGFMLRSTGRPVEFSGKMYEVTFGK
jgi:hypothetical protein